MSNQSIKVSVIIPAYNVELYVESALLSIMNQSLRDIEIIVVNDGSTDGTLDIIEKLSMTDSRIRVISTPNQGLSVARNTGLYSAVGEYVYFFDSDDLLEDRALEICYDKCKLNELDFLFFDADVFSDVNSPILSKFNYHRSNKYKDLVYRGVEILQKQLDTDGYSSSACLSFMNRSFLLAANLFFYPKIVHEDELFTIMMYLKAERVGLTPHVLFHRRIRENSIMTSSYSMKNAKGCITVCRELKKYAMQVDTSKLEYVLLKRRINTLIVSILFNGERQLTSVENRYLKRIISEFVCFMCIKTYIRYKMPFLFRIIKKYR